MKKCLLPVAVLSLAAFSFTHADDLAGFVPPDDGYDWIQLTSGEWLKGELVGLFDEEVDFDSEILDDLTLDWEDISTIYSPRILEVRIQGQRFLQGKVRIDQNNVIVSGANGEIVYPRESLLAISSLADRERDRWMGELALGTNFRRGNTEFVEYNMIAHLERRTPVSRGFVDYIGTFNETDGEQISNNHRLNLVFDRFNDSRFFWRPFSLQYLRDPFQNIAHQGTFETGVGYELVDTGRTEWDLHSGIGFNVVERVSVEADQERRSTSPTFSLGTDFETELTEWLDYLFSFQMTFVDEASGEYQHHMLTTLSTDLVAGLDLDISLIWDRVQKPPANAIGETPERDDYRLLIGVSLDF